MPLTVGNFTGDGLIADLIDCDITLPDSGQSVTIVGTVKKVGSAQVTVTGSPLTAPVVPGSGSTYWIIQVDYTTGAASILQSATAMPAAAANNIVVFQMTLTAGLSNANMALDPSATPDDW